MGHVVTAAYVTLRVKDDLGNEVLQGFYAGGVLPDDANEDDLEKLTRKGMVAEQGTKEAERATPFGQPVMFDEGGMPKSAAQIAEDEANAERRASAKSTRPAKSAPASSSSKDS